MKTVQYMNRILKADRLLVDKKGERYGKSV